MLTLLGGITLLIIIGGVILFITKKVKAKGLLGRAANLAEGKADKVMENLEKDDPEAVFRSAIKEAKSELVELNEMSREVKGLEYQEKESVENLEVEKADLQKMLDVAIEQEEEDLGSTIIENMGEIDERIAEHTKNAETYRIQGEDSIKMRNDKNKEVKELEVEMKQANNVTKSSEIVNRIRDRKNGMANDAVSEGLNSARSKMSEAKASLRADKDIEESSIESRMKKLKEAGAKSAGKSKMAELIAAKKNKG